MKFRRSRSVEQPQKIGPAPCTRCAGSGVYTEFHGQCFRCVGKCIDPTHRTWVYPSGWSDEQCQEHVEKLERVRVHKNRQRAERVRLAAARKRATSAAECPLLHALEVLQVSGEGAGLTRHDTRTVSGMAGNWRPVTEAQHRLVCDIIARALIALSTPAPELEIGSRQTIVVKVLKHDTKIGFEGRPREVVTLKTDEGAILWGTCPSGLYRTPAGETATITLTVGECWAAGCYKFSRPRVA